MRTRGRSILLASLALAACNDEPAEHAVPPRDSAATPGAATQDGAKAHALPALEYDFGVIPHGESRTHDYAIDLAQLPAGPWVPLHVSLDCSCGRGQLLFRAADGSERILDGRPSEANTARPGEQLLARVVLDTLTKDPEDLPHTLSRGFVVLQPLADLTGHDRVRWPFLVRFGIDCPVRVTPFAALDFGAVPQSQSPSIPLLLRGDEQHAAVHFGPAESSDPSIEVRLEPGDGEHEARLHARCHPGELGNHRAVLAVGTDLAGGYRVNIGVTWKVIPDLTASPMAKLSFRAALDRAQTEADASSQYLMVSNHDLASSAEFAVHEIVGPDGIDAA
ncbi:MAG: hypothetical protein KDE27_05415, partial [Planctomycetes bacterium]|nr:hypothetical protein [Planctomycetota bacterium]